MLAHSGSPRKLDDERDRLLPLVPLELVREDARFDKDLPKERAFRLALRVVDLMLRVIMSSNNRFE